jgi:hypothetical protein
MASSHKDLGLSNGKWSGRESRCRTLSALTRKFNKFTVDHYCVLQYYYVVAVDCGMLSHPRNSYIYITKTTFGSLAFLSCAYGFKRQGSQTRECLSNGKWSGRELRCRRVDCGKLSPRCRRKFNKFTVDHYCVLQYYYVVAVDCGSALSPTE